MSIISIRDAYVSGSYDVIKQLEDGALKLKMEINSLITKNLGYNILQVDNI